MGMCRTTGGLNLQLSTLEVKINVLMEVLQLGQTSSEPLLLFNKALMPNLALAPLLIDTLQAPSSCLGFSFTAHQTRKPSVSSFFQLFLSQHISYRLERESECKHSANVSLHLACLALLSVNASCLLGRYVHTLWDSVTQVLHSVPKDFTLCSLKQFKMGVMPCSKFVVAWTSLITSDGTTFAICHHSSLQLNGFSGDVQSSLMDMPFDGAHLYGEKSDSTLKRIRESRATACSLGFLST